MSHEKIEGITPGTGRRKKEDRMLYTNDSISVPVGGMCCVGTGPGTGDTIAAKIGYREQHNII